MARYIDADKMIDGYSTTFPYDLCYCDDGDLMEWLNNQPTADVVPKSEADNLIEVIDNTTQQFLELHDLYQNEKREVERLEHILDCYALQYGTVTDQQKVIDKVKAEVARGIFDELEEVLCGEYLTERFWFDLGKLRIKYTEGDHDRNSKD